MRRAFWFILLAFGLPAATLGQAASSDSQTLQALLTEIRDLRQDLRISLAKMQNAQILLFRLQSQQSAVSSASERLDDVRSTLAGAQEHRKSLTDNIKRLEDTLSAEDNLAQQKILRDRISTDKSDLETTVDIEQRTQASEIESEQQLRTEQDKLNALETRLDELIRSMGSAKEQTPLNALR